MNAPPSSDSRWIGWARPLAAFLRVAPRTRLECVRFSVGRGASFAQAKSVSPWLELEGLARAEAGRVSLTPEGIAWVGDERVERRGVGEPGVAPGLPHPILRRQGQSGGGERDSQSEAGDLEPFIFKGTPLCASPSSPHPELAEGGVRVKGVITNVAKQSTYGLLRRLEMTMFASPHPTHPRAGSGRCLFARPVL